jgi:aldose 1-epimerase
LVTVIQGPPQLAEIRRRPSWWGVPLLFPFPGVIPRGEYVFDGTRYRLGRPEQPIVSEGHETPGARRDYHGFVMDLPWRVVSCDADDARARVVSRLDSADHPETMEGFPFPFSVEAAYRLDAAGLRLDFRATNPGPGRLPFGFGAHPFFKLPLGERGSASECLVCVPAASRWNARAIRAALDGSGPMPSPDDVKMPVPPELDLRVPRPFVERAFNGMFSDLVPVDGAGGTGGTAAHVVQLKRR